jgi:ferritin-like metal-binding protein YciE
MAKNTTLKELLVEEIRDLYDAERQLIKALPKLARAATSDELREAIESHLQETEGHVEKLETVFESLGERPRGKHCAGIAGIIEEGNNLIGEDFDGAVLDAGIIAGAQRAEHYEIGAYGCVIAWANVLGLSDIVGPLEEILEEEKAADEKLSAIAEGSVNEQAGSEGESEDEGEEGGEDEEENESEGESVGAASSGRSRSAGRADAGTGRGGNSRPSSSSRRR